MDERASTPSWLGLAPLRPFSAAPSILGVEWLASEPLAKGIGVDRIGEAEHPPPLIAMENGLSAWAERQVAAEVGMDLVVRAGAGVLRQGNLVRPPSIDEGCCQLAFAPGHVGRCMFRIVQKLLLDVLKCSGPAARLPTRP